jgi:hypothetical protein
MRKRFSGNERALFSSRCIDKAEPIESLLDAIAEFADPNPISGFGVRSRTVQV